MSGSGEAATDALETRIGYRFADRSLLDLALTHSSATAKRDATSNERLEFLGDRILGLAIAELLMESFPDALEGELSRRLAAMVRKETCAEVADDIDLRAALRTGPGKSHVTLSMLSDACEALIAAVYLDGGLPAARGFVERQWAKRIIASPAVRRDAKTTLQEWGHSRGARTPSYTIVDKSGPEHDPLFRVSVELDGIEPGSGLGRSRREAEQEAAAAVLVRQGVWPQGSDT